MKSLIVEIREFNLMCWNFSILDDKSDEKNTYLVTSKIFQIPNTPSQCVENV